MTLVFHPVCGMQQRVACQLASMRVSDEQTVLVLVHSYFTSRTYGHLQSPPNPTSTLTSSNFHNIIALSFNH